MKALFRLRVKDFNQFVAELDKLASSYDCSTVTTYRIHNNINEAVVVATDIDADEYEQFRNSVEFQDYVKRTGVIGEPEVLFLEEVKTVSPTHH